MVRLSVGIPLQPSYANHTIFFSYGIWIALLRRMFTRVMFVFKCFLCNYLNKRAQLSQQCTIVIAGDTISHHFKFKFKCFIFPTEVHDLIYNLYVVRFWREGGQRSIAYGAVHLPWITNFIANDYHCHYTKLVHLLLLLGIKFCSWMRGNHVYYKYLPGNLAAILGAWDKSSQLFIPTLKLKRHDIS